MGKNLTEKIIEKHLVSGNMNPGEEIALRIDQTLTQDATGTLVYLQFEAMSIPRVRTELSVSYVDHNTLQSDFKNMDDHVFLRTVAAKYGIYFSRPGNGICHQVHLERFGIPGKTLLGSDSHTPTAGGLGMLAIGAGGLNVAVAMAGGPFIVIMPAVIGVKLSGRLKPLCSAKDVILTILKMETVKGGVGNVYEYFGEGVASLTIPERATITNMGAELGATSSIFPSDDITKEFLACEKREKDWGEFSADSNARYSKVIEIDLGDIVPMVATPHMPDKVVPVSELKGKKVDQVVIGSCTNSSINDLGVAADILDSKMIPDHVSFGISPGSRQAFKSAIEAGIIGRLVGSGARILELACGPCIGMGFAPCSEGVTIRTFNRNFKGRSGTPDADVFLVSPETAAATALKGEITDPRKIKSFTKRDYTKHVLVDDSMIIPPSSAPENVEIVKGPNIKPCPLGNPLDSALSLEIIIKTGDNITTDHIMPAGAEILPLRSNIPEIAKHVFEGVDKEFYSRTQKSKRKLAIIGGENYGQGSSREHAALAPMFLGVKAVIAKSFARIHKENLINFGILPLTFADPLDYDHCEQGDFIDIDELKAGLSKGNTIVARTGKGKEVKLTATLTKRDIDVLLSGGLLNYTRSKIS
jgi:aconitate hydratase